MNALNSTAANYHKYKQFYKGGRPRLMSDEQQIYQLFTAPNKNPYIIKLTYIFLKKSKIKAYTNSVFFELRVAGCFSCDLFRFAIHIRIVRTALRTPSLHGKESTQMIHSNNSFANQTSTSSLHLQLLFCCKSNEKVCRNAKN